MSDCSLFINPEIKSFWVENPIWNLDKYKYSQIDIIQTSKGEIYFTQNCRSCKYSSWWMSQILSSLRSFTISLLWQFRKRHNVCGQRILMFKYFETQYWNFPGSWSWDRCKLEVMSDGGQWRRGHGPTYNLHTGRTQVLAVSSQCLQSWNKLQILEILMENFAADKGTDHGSDDVLCSSSGQDMCVMLCDAAMLRCTPGPS